MLRLILLFFIFINFLFADIITLSKDIDKVHLNQIKYIKDNNYKFKELRDKKFKNYKKQTNTLFRFPFENESTYWVKIKLKNISKEKIKKYINIDIADIKSVVFYELDSKTKDFSVLKKKKTFTYALELKKDQTKIVFIKFYNYLSPTTFNLNICDQERFILREQHIKLLHGLFLGFMLFASIYFIIASIFMKKAFYSFYIIHILAITAYQLFVQGYPKIYFPSLDFTGQAKVICGAISVSSFMIFVLFLLRYNLRLFYKRLFFIIIFITLFGTWFFILEITNSQILAGIFLIGYISIAFASIDSYKRGNYYGLPIFISSLIIIFGGLIYALAIIFQVIPLTNLTLNSISISNLGEVFVILFTFMVYLKRTDDEKQKILSQKIDMEKSFSKNLQLEVNRKTKQLEEINETLNIKIKQAIDKTKEQEKLLFSQNRLATMGETISIIAHQWRNPISILSSHINHMELSLKYKKEFDQKDFLSTIKKSQDVLIHLSSTIDVFQNYLKPSNDELNSSFKLIDVIQKGLLLYKDSMKNDHIEVFEKFETKDINIKGNSEDFIQVLISLFSNSKDALIKNTKNNKKIIIKTKLKNDRVYIDIYDNGGGIFIKPIQQIFEPYFTSKKENGFGLGLFIAREIVIKKLNGKIKVKSKLRSTIFTIELPV